MDTKKERAPCKVLPQSYGSVSSLMRGEGIPQEVQEKVAQLRSESCVVLQLAQLRQMAGKTQQEMADALGVTQSAISKLEAGKDEDLTLRQVREYARVARQRIWLTLGAPLTHFEAVKVHAQGLKTHLEKLAEIAVQNDELETRIKSFFGEAFFNLFNIMALCNDKLPKGEDNVEIRLELIQGNRPMRGREMSPPLRSESEMAV